MGPGVEVVLKGFSAVNQVGDEGSLLNGVVLLVQEGVVKLLLALLHVLQLHLLDTVSPLGHQLFGLIVSVDVVEDRELGSKEHVEMSSFHPAEEPADNEFLLEDHFSGPVGV